MPAGDDAAGERRAVSALVFVDDLDGLELRDEDEHHLARALRLRPGELVIAADGRGAWRRCVVADRPTAAAGAGRRHAAGGRRRLRLEPDGERRAPSPATPEIEIGFALAKPERTEWAVAKLVELGVDRLSPIVAERTPGRGGEVEGARWRPDRLERIVRESAMQARRLRLPELSPPAPLAEVLARAIGPVALAEPGGAPLTGAVSTVLVGPEGGWSATELAAAPALVTLGDTILRVETAAVAAGAILGALRASAGRPAPA